MSSAAFSTGPREGHLRVLTVPGSKVHAGEYVSKDLYFYTANNAVLTTVDSVTDALKVRIAPTRNPGVVEVLNSPDPAYRFLGVALNRPPENVDFLGGDWGAVTLVSNPNEAKVTSVFKTEGTIKGAGWFIGGGGEIVFHWDHSDGCVYRLSHSVEFPTRRVYNVANFPAYVNYYFKNEPERYAEVNIVFEPLDQAGL